YLLSSSFFSLSLHDALPICFCPLFQFGIVQRSLLNIRLFYRQVPRSKIQRFGLSIPQSVFHLKIRFPNILSYSLRYFLKKKFRRSEEHTSELQPRENLVCRL